MLDDLLGLLYRFPGACRTFGSALYSAAGFALVCGAYAQVGTSAASMAVGMAGQAPVTQLAQLLPGVWTWWVPESFAGVVFYVVVAGAGAVLALAAKRTQRQLRAF